MAEIDTARKASFAFDDGALVETPKHVQFDYSPPAPLPQQTLAPFPADTRQFRVALACRLVLLHPAACAMPVAWS